MKLPPLTYTFLSTWENCPLKAYEVYVAKSIPYKETPAMKRGDDVHKAFEDRINEGKPLPEDMPYEKFVHGLDAGQAEMKLAILQDGSPCDFWAPNVWARGKADLFIMAAVQPATWGIIIDWKTGKKREDAGELKFHATLLHALKPELKSISGHYVWLKDGEWGKEHDLSDTAGHFKHLREKRREMEEAHRLHYWPAKQNPLCAWCNVKKCKFNTNPELGT